jgi:hypothetical protein
MDLSQLGRVLVSFGVILLLVGLLLILGGRIPFLGRLPGDIVFQRDGLTVFFPFATMILVSVFLTVVLNVLARLFGKE